MLLQLLLIFSLSSLGSSIKYSIEKERCKTDTACFIRQSCLNQTGTNSAKLVQYYKEPLNNDVCDVFLQIRPFSSKKLLILLQVDSTVDSNGVALIQTEEQFRCNNEYGSTENAKLKASSFGERHPTDPNSVFCSFILETRDSSTMIYSLFEGNLAYPELKFHSGESVSIKYQWNDNTFWLNIHGRSTCDPDRIDSFQTHNNSHIFGKVDTTRSPIICSAFETLRIERGDKRVHYADSFYCKNGEWKYEIVKGGQPQIVGMLNNVKEIVNVFCTRQLCSLCPPLEDLACGGGCTVANYNNTPGQCAITTCPNNFWRLEKGNTINREIECRHKASSQDMKRVEPSFLVSSWYMTNTDELITKASCAQDADCARETRWGVKVIAGCPDRPCNPYCISKKHELYCQDNARLRSQTKGTIYNHTKLYCDIISGKYSDKTGNEMPNGTKIFCEIVEKRSEEAPVASAEISKEVIVGIFAGIGVILIVGGFCAVVYLIMRRRQARYDEWAKRCEEERNNKRKGGEDYRLSHLTKSERVRVAFQPLDDAISAARAQKLRTEAE